LRRRTDAIIAEAGGLSILQAMRQVLLCADVLTDITFPGLDCAHAVGYDTLNGTEQPLVVSQVDGRACLRGMWVRDYPTLIRVSAGPR